MSFNIHDVTLNYQRNHSPYRELAKYLFSICTFGLGALWFAATTIVVEPTRRDIAGDGLQLDSTMSKVALVSVATRSIASVVYTQLGLAVRELGGRGVNNSSRHWLFSS